MNNITFNNVWAMPSKDTFTIKPIRELIDRYVVYDENICGNNWIDIMAGNNSPAEVTNDLNINTLACSHLDAMEFVLQWENCVDKFNGCLFDPPYSPRQVKEMYDGIGGNKNNWNGTMSYYSKLKDILAKIIKIDGYAISFGWCSNGFGKNRGFETVEILLVKHGGWHNDTIVTVEKKIGAISE